MAPRAAIIEEATITRAAVTEDAKTIRAAFICGRGVLRSLGTQRTPMLRSVMTQQAPAFVDRQRGDSLRTQRDATVADAAITSAAAIEGAASPAYTYYQRSDHRGRRLGFNGSLGSTAAWGQQGWHFSSGARCRRFAP